MARRMTGSPAIESSGGNVQEFIWASEGSSVGYIADQETDEVFELFASTPDGDETVKLSGSFAEDEDGDVLFFEWASESDSEDR